MCVSECVCGSMIISSPMIGRALCLVDTVHEGYLTSVNRFYSTDWYTVKCVEVVYKSAHNCNGSLVNLDFLK